MAVVSSDASVRQVLIVTPCRDGAVFLDQTIMSVVSQVGSFELHYHVQDGLSTDGTHEILRKWELALGSDQDSSRQRKVHFSWASEPDRGMYDAINKGFDELLRSADKQFPATADEVVMAWINSDDLLPPGALQTVASFFQARPDAHWVTGIASVIDSRGGIQDTREPPWPHSTAHIGAGLYDGRGLPFVQQEGTFWRQTLWAKAGGVNGSMRLAGDWDLWRRFANHADLITYKAVLGYHRRHSAQLSADVSAYWREIDEYRRSTPLDPLLDPDSWITLSGLLGGWDSDSATYSVYRSAAPSPKSNTTESSSGFCINADLSQPGSSPHIRDKSGLSSIESWGRWSDSDSAPSVRFSFFESIPSRFKLVIRMKVLCERNNPVTLSCGTWNTSIKVSTEFKEYVFNVLTGDNVECIDLRPAGSPSPQELGFGTDSRRIAIGISTILLIQADAEKG